VVEELSSVYTTGRSVLFRQAMERVVDLEDMCVVRLSNGQYAVRNDCCDVAPAYLGDHGYSKGWKANTSCSSKAVNCGIYEATRVSGVGKRGPKLELFLILVLLRDVRAGEEIVVSYDLPDGVPCRCGRDGCGWAPAPAPPQGWSPEAYSWTVSTMYSDEELYSLSKISRLEELRTVWLSHRVRELRGVFLAAVGWEGEYDVLGMARSVKSDGHIGAQALGVAAEEFAGRAAAVLSQAESGGADPAGFMRAAVEAEASVYLGLARCAGYVSRALLPLPVEALVEHLRWDFQLSTSVRKIARPVRALTIGRSAYLWGRGGSYLPPGAHGASETDLREIAALGKSGAACAFRLHYWASAGRYGVGLAAGPAFFDRLPTADD
jgi:hypothetical protein